MGIWKKCGGYFYSGCTFRLLGTFVSWGFGFFFSPSSFFIFPLLKFEFIKERRNAFCSMFGLCVFVVASRVENLHVIVSWY